MRKFIKHIGDFCAAHCPALYKVAYKIRYNVRKKKCGDLVLIQTSKFPDCVRQDEICDFSLALPLDFSTEISNRRIAAVIHIFYTELAEEIKNLLYNVPAKIDVYISTVSEEKKFELEKIFADFNNGHVTIKIFPNRGRDIAPAFIGFKDIYKNYELCLHLHTKKSPHATNRLFGWREYLYNNLLGSQEIVRGIFKVMENPRVGIIFPQYFSPIRISVNWGENYSLTQKFLSGLKINLDTHNLLEFPAGSMFWFKPAALTPIFESELTFEDFPEELGQTDGTLAHAMERSFLYIAESAGYSWVKVSACPNENTAQVLKSFNEEELDANIKKVWKSVLTKNIFGS